MITVERVYAAEHRQDGRRYFLVDRLWPRGMKKESLRLDAWLRDAAPSTELRQWYRHDPALWDEFKRRYFQELDSKPEVWAPLLEAARKSDIVLLYSTKEDAYNNAAALKEYLAPLIPLQGLLFSVMAGN